MMGETLDDRFRRVFSPGESARTMGLAADEAHPVLGGRPHRGRHQGRRDAQATGLEPDALVYTPLAELDGVSDKAVRDAGAIPVTAI